MQTGIDSFLAKTTLRHINALNNISLYKKRDSNLFFNKPFPQVK